MMKLILLLIAFLPAPLLQAASGTWTNRNGGSWTNALNWNAGIIADGSGNAANFSTVNLPADTVVTLDAPRTIGSLTFDDQNATKHNWRIQPGNSASLTLAGASPSITVLSATTTLTAPLAGTSGLTKAGIGRLALGSANTYSGTTTVNAGTLALQSSTFSAASPLNISGASAAVESAGTLNLNVNTSATAIDVSGAGILRLTGATNGPTAPDLFFGPNHSGNTCWGARLASTLDLGNQQRFVFGNTGHNGVGPYGLTGADCQFAGSVIGSGGLTFIAQGTWSDMEVPFALNASNAFTGPVEIRRGSVYLGHAAALRRTNLLSFNVASGHNGRLFLYGNSALVANLTSTGSGSAAIANGNLKSGASLTLPAADLIVHQTSNTTFAGSISDTLLEYPGSGSGTTGPLNLHKAGAATLRLSGNSTYTGSTIVSNGTLQVDGALGTSAVSVRQNATLAGQGVIQGPVTVLNGAVLAPGTGAGVLGTLTINNTLSLAGTTLMEVSKVGTTLACDRLTGISTLTFGGSLEVTNISDVHTGALSPGESFKLFDAASHVNSFATTTLPPLSAGLTWDTGNLAVNGTITVVGTSAPPVMVVQPSSQNVAEGSPVSFSAMAAGVRPLAYQWHKNGTPLAGATSTSYALPTTTTNDSAAFTLVASNSFGSSTSMVALLNVFPPGAGSTVTNGLVVYLNFDGNILAQAGTTNSGAIYTGGATLGPRYRAGVIGQAAAFANSPVASQPNDWAITLGNLEWLYANSFSVSLWERTIIPGDDALMGNKNWTSGANVGWVLSSLDAKNLNYNAVGGTRRDIDLHPPFSDSTWHLITLTFNRTANQVTSYVDGLPVNTSDLSPSGTASLNAGFSTLVGSSGNGLYSATADIDDLGMWNRALTPEEVAGIYGAGLAGRPLTAAFPGQPPTITAQPISLSTTPGRDATFSVVASGPGPFAYQWKFNGTNIAGATNSTLVISSVTTANQGVYAVLVSSSSGAVLSAGAVLAVYPIEVTGQWDFDGGDLRATVGAALEFRGTASLRTSFPYVGINGRAARAMQFGTNGVADGYYMTHGAKPNGGGRFVNQYTLIMDVLFPASSTGQWRALFQSDPFNHEGNDAEFYVGNASATPEGNGIGAAGEFHGPLAPDTWYRIAFAVDLTAPSGQQLSKYVNGVKVASQSLPGGIDGQFALGPSAVLFASGLTTSILTQPGLANSLQFVNGWMSPAQLAALAGPSAEGLPAGDAALKIESLTKDATAVNLTWAGPDGVFQVLESPNLTNPVWQAVATFTNTRNITLPVTGPTSFYRIKQPRSDIRVGQLPFGEQSLPTKQIVRPAGAQAQFPGRPVDLALSPDAGTVYVKNLNNLLVLDATSWAVRQTLSYPGNGASMHGIAVAADGSRIYVTGAGNELYEWTVASNGVVAFSRTIALPGGSYPCGVALSADASRAYVCLSVANRLAVVDLAGGTVTQQINVGIAPWDVALSPDGTKAFVSDWGGRPPISGDLTAPSAGTQVVIDSRGVASSGAVSFVNLTTATEIAKVAVGLHPSDLELSPDGAVLYVANANSDTVSVLDTQTRALKETILVRPDPSFPYGSAANGLALSKDGKTLFVASGGNNSVAVVELPNAQHTNSLLRGFLPADWYPGAVVAGSNHLFVVNVKGLGTRQGQPAVTAWQIGAFLGTANKIAIPNDDSLSKFTAQSFEQGRVSYIRQTQQLARPGQPPVPVPLNVGEPSVFQHVVYILKENKTYDQVFGDLPQGNGEPSLCVFPEFVTPNHHALARQYVLLDNFYCNGVNSADGHSWSTEANVTDHLEKSFGGFTRSYTFGDDPLTYSSTGFIWNNVLQHGLTFRNYGEMDYASTSPAASWLQIYNDYLNGTGAIRYVQNIGIASLRPYSSTNVPGWNMEIPDVVRAAGFIKELNQAQSNGVWQAFHFLYLPNDHTGGAPSPRAQVADNDLSLGQCVEAISKSIFWSNTVIFVIEDDPQSGYDHVDGHRSICLVISPWTKRSQVVSTFYNQAGVLHTMERILGLPPMNQQDAMAPLMFGCFTNVPNYAPYTALPSNIPLTEGVTTTAALSPKARYWAAKVEKMDLTRPDRIDDDAFNRFIWHANKGDTPYPAKFVGAHGRGLKRLGLVLEKSTLGDGDD